MIRYTALAIGLVGMPLFAQGVVSPLNPVDTSNLATKSDVQAASSAASTAQTAAQSAATLAAAAQASVPPTCVTMPASDTYTGSIGSLAGCTPPRDAARATQVQATTATTVADGSFTGIWKDGLGNATPFPSTPSYAHAEINSGSTPYVCQMTATTTTGYNGKCFQVVSTTLPGTLLALGGLIVSPISSANAGLTVKIIARQ